MGADNALVTPLVYHGEQAITSRTQDKQQQTPQQIPATIVSTSGGLATVKAEMHGNFTIPQTQYPIAGYSEWFRPPVVNGDKGWLVSADYYLGGQSGLGGGVANFRGRANLTNMVWQPISEKSFSSNNTWDNQAFLIAGPNGAKIMDAAGNAIVQVDVTNKKIIVNPHNTQYMVYLGGDGVTGSYSNVSTTGGPCPRVFGRTDA